MTAPTVYYESGIINGTAAEPKQDYFEQSATQKYDLGARYVLPDGRAFRYARAGAAALAAGELQQSAVAGGTTTYQNDLTPSAAAAGATIVSVTTVTDAITANTFAGGYLAVTDGGASIGQGEMYKIVSHTGGAAGALLFTLDRGLTTAWTTSSRITIIRNPYDLVVQAVVTTPTGMALGVPTIPVSINYYCWLQTWGIANCLVKTALTAGTNVIRDVAAAGSVGIDNGILAEAVVGHTGWVTATTDSGFVFLTIAP